MRLNSLFKDLFLLPGVSGREDQVREYVKNYFKKYPNYEIKTDGLGSVFGVKKSKNKDAKTVMVGGHLDEVGFIVANINPNGGIMLQSIGGINGEVVLSQVLEVHTENGIIPGVVGAKPPHLKEGQSTKVSDLVLDIGARSKEEALKWGIKLGQMITFANSFTYTHDKTRVISKAVDNRVGVGVVLEIARLLHDVELDFNLVVGATVQEEVGLRGAQTSANLFKPDIFIAIDSSPINDINDPNSLGKMGDGAMLRLYDPGVIMPEKLRDYLEEVATNSKIKYQHYFSKGNTDASRVLLQNYGVLSTAVVLPSRYIHSNASMFEISDLQDVIDLVEAIINDLNNDKIKKLTKY